MTAETHSTETAPPPTPNVRISTFGRFVANPV